MYKRSVNHKLEDVTIFAESDKCSSFQFAGSKTGFESMYNHLKAAELVFDEIKSITFELNDCTGASWEKGEPKKKVRKLSFVFSLSEDTWEISNNTPELTIKIGQAELLRFMEAVDHKVKKRGDFIFAPKAEEFLPHKEGLHEWRRKNQIFFW